MALSEINQHNLRNIVISAITSLLVIVTFVWAGGMSAGHLENRVGQLEKDVTYHHQLQEPAQDAKIQADHDAVIRLETKMDALIKQIAELQVTNTQLVAEIKARK